MVIESDEAIREYQARIGIRRPMRGGASAIGFDFVAEISHKPAIEVEWQFWGFDTAVQLGLQEVEQRSVEDFAAAVLIENQAPVGGRVGEPETPLSGRSAHERESRPALFRCVQPEGRTTVAEQRAECPF